MNPNCLEHRLSADERGQFERDGYLVVPNALEPDHVARLGALVDRSHQAALASGVAAHEPWVLRNFLPVDDAFVELVDHPRVFPKVWGILGYNIYVYHAHLGVSPPLGKHPVPDSVVKRFHQDSGRVNEEVEGDPRPRLSLKVAYFLEGDPGPGNGNMWLVPGSHLKNDGSGPLNSEGEPPGARAVSVAPGSALIFDRRIWHSKSPNLGQSTRKALFYGYAYRWLRTKDEMTVQHLYPRLDPIRRQLLGDGTSADGFYSPTRADLPLLGWLEQHDPKAIKPTKTVFA